MGSYIVTCVCIHCLPTWLILCFRQVHAVYAGVGGKINVEIKDIRSDIPRSINEIITRYKLDISSSPGSKIILINSCWFCQADCCAVTAAANLNF